MMTQAQLATASLNDIVFDGRNKEYGAYELRALYERHVKQALAWASVVLLLLLLYPVVSRLMADAFPAPVIKTTGVIEIQDIQDPSRVTPPPPIVPPVTPPPPPAAAEPVASVRFTTNMKVDRDEKASTDPVPDHEMLLTTNPGLTTAVGQQTTEPSLTDLESHTSGPLTEVVDTKIYTYVEQMPELMSGGGMAAIVAAIQKAAKYPSAALNAGVEGKVYANFTVNAEGEISNVQIVKGLGFGIDEETIRAIKMLPHFRPGKQNGRPVSVSFTVPVSFNIK
ncbi:energy transducer TonB [Hymenobacter sp. ASUV-10]|uniref:Energy transducer TonB n=1 Tax=Hymenobacter aranciens TaxID=3063996 RepID=A0ABT9BAB3_9BACT|nr:energy transducer TonB [Hymenobacter sp. ASUV-10]MDO7875209.1 energy transducer TonB [Hymenobacter sp. ASUV-10]